MGKIEQIPDAGRWILDKRKRILIDNYSFIIDN